MIWRRQLRQQRARGYRSFARCRRRVFQAVVARRCDRQTSPRKTLASSVVLLSLFSASNRRSRDHETRRSPDGNSRLVGIGVGARSSKSNHLLPVVPFAQTGRRSPSMRPFLSGFVLPPVSKFYKSDEATRANPTEVPRHGHYCFRSAIPNRVIRSAL